jgi:PAS domain S-box-containing protein
VSRQDQAILFNAIPLLILAGACLGVVAVLAPALWRERSRASAADIGLALLFLCVGIPSLVLGILVLLDGEPLAGNLWLAFFGILVALVPAVLMLARVRDRHRLARGAVRLREAEARVTERDLELEVVARLSKALARTGDVETAGRTLLEAITSVLRADFVALAIVDPEASEARGLVGRLDGRELDWWRELRLDLRHEPSGIASAVFDAAPVSIHDVAKSTRVSKRLVDRLGAKSAAFVPLVTEGGVIGVIVVATTRQVRAFEDEELELMEALAAEAALALERTRSADALARVLERERLVASISRKVRSELDVDAVIRVAVTETGRALHACRCFIRLDAPGGLPIAAEWHEPGFEPIPPELATLLPVSNLAAQERRTVVVADTAEDPLIQSRNIPEREALRGLGARAALATPVVVFDRGIGVLTLHRPEPGPWSAGEVTLAEAVAGELGLAIHTARLLRENERRIAEQASLLRAAQVVTSDLRLNTVLDSLVTQVAELLDADAADCYLSDPEHGVLRCAAVHGLSPELVGFEFPSGRGLMAQAIAEGRPVRSEDYAGLGGEIPHEAYTGFASAIVAPMAWGGRIRGFVGAGSRDPARVFGHVDADLLETFANLVSLALRNAESYEQSARQARIQRGFYRIASVLAEPLSLQETFDALAQAAGEALGAGAAAVLVPRRGRLELAAEYQLSPGLVAAFRGPVEAGAALIGAAEARQIVAAGVLEGDERFVEAWRRPALASGHRAVLAVPFEAPQTDEAGLVVAFFEAERRFSDDDLELARRLAGAARGALERSELFEAERTSRALAQQLARTGVLLATELDPDAVLDEVVAQAPALLGADACSIRIVDGDELVVSAASGEGAAESIGSRSPITGLLAGDVVQSRLPVAVADVSSHGRVSDSDPLLAGHVAYLGVPLVRPEGGVHGVLGVYDRAGRTWRQEEIEALDALASNASAALSSAELYQRVALEKERSVAIIANIADGIVAVGRDGLIVLWNAAAERITGIPTGEALGHAPEHVLRRELRSEGDAPAGDRLLSIRRGDEEVWLSLTEAVMRDPAGQVAGRIFAFRDISAERVVDDMKSTFVSTVSHELRTPLTSIYGFAETLLREDVHFGEDQRRTFLTYIASESERLSRIVEQLLSVARLETGDLQIRLAATDVRGVVQEAVAAAERLAGGGPNGHRFVVDLPGEPLDAEADREQLAQILGNLIDNAVRFSPSGATVTVAARRAGDSVELRVDDEGDGIPAGAQRRIFTKFSRADGSVSGTGGTGLGLFIAQGLVTAMGGRISVSSSEGVGSTFVVELPAAGKSQD